MKGAEGSSMTEESREELEHYSRMEADIIHKDELAAEMKRHRDRVKEIEAGYTKQKGETTNKDLDERGPLERLMSGCW